LFPSQPLPHATYCAATGSKAGIFAVSVPPVTIELPASWVPKLVVPRDVIDTRVPKGSKKVIYQFSEHEIFALFGETSKFDGCVERLTVYSDEAHQMKLEVRVVLARISLMDSSFVVCIVRVKFPERGHVRGSAACPKVCTSRYLLVLTAAWAVQSFGMDCETKSSNVNVMDTVVCGGPMIDEPMKWLSD
jgi:hypothetical protein